jgi:hypothetical protein
MIEFISLPHSFNAENKWLILTSFTRWHLFLPLACIPTYSTVLAFRKSYWNNAEWRLIVSHIPQASLANAPHLKRAIISNHQFFNIYLQSFIDCFKIKLFNINCWRSSAQLMIFLIINSKRFAIVLSWSRIFFCLIAFTRCFRVFVLFIFFWVRTIWLSRTSFTMMMSFF